MKFTTYNSVLLFMSISACAMDKLSTQVAIEPPKPRDTIRIGMLPTALCYVHNGSALVAAMRNCAVVVCDPTPVSVIWMKGNSDIDALDTNPQHTNLIALQGASKNITICDIKTSEPVEHIENVAGSTMLKYNKDGNQLLVTTRQNSAKLVDIRSKSTSDILSAIKIKGAYYNPSDNNTVALMNNDTIELYDIKASKTALTIPFVASLINVAFNNEGNKIIASGTTTLAVLDAIVGNTLAQYPIQGKIASQTVADTKLRAPNAAFFPNQSKFLASQWNGWMTLADANDPKYQKTFQFRYETQYCQFFPVTISPNGDDMPVVQPDTGAIYVYDVSAYKQ